MLLGQDLQVTASSPRKGRRGPLDYIIPPMKRPPLAGWLRHAVRSAWFWITIWVVLVVTAVSVISIMYWDWLSIESNGSTIRNIVLVAAAMIALPLAIWRSTVAERQSETAQRSLLNERYQKGAEMLGSEVLSVRLGGIYALARLAREHPGDYHTQIMSLLCAFARNPTVVEERDASELREDVQAVMTVVRERSEAQIEIEKEGEYRLNLFGANLNGAILSRAKLTRANLNGAILNGAILSRAILSGAELEDAHLEDAYLILAELNWAKLMNAHLNCTHLDAANLSHADLRGCEGLTQEQINKAVPNSEDPPNLTDVLDANTGKPLVWGGR